jgi:hypothetical protein
MTLTTFQFPLYRSPYELGAVFAVLKNGVDAVKRAVREACRGLLVVDLLPTHASKIDDITYCYKPYFPLASSGIGDIIYSSERRRAMTQHLTIGTAKITHQNGLVTVRFMRDGAFTVGTQLFGDCNKGWNAAFRFCRVNALRVLSCEC